MQHGDYFLGLKYATCLYVYQYLNIGTISRLKIVRVTRHP